MFVRPATPVRGIEVELRAEAKFWKTINPSMHADQYQKREALRLTGRICLDFW
jgi:hypothetical protein